LGIESVPGRLKGVRNPLADVERRSLVRALAVALVLAVALWGIPLLGGDWVTTFTSVGIYSVVAASLGVLYGRVGMISLCQIALLAVGTWVGARFAYLTALPFPVLLLIAGLITGVIGVLIGLPALRLGGLHLALITLMAAGAVTVILNQINFPNGGGGFRAREEGTSNIDVRRPDIALDDTSYYRYTVIVCALLFAVALLHVALKPGRAWAAIRESEPAALAAGVNITLHKLWAFALASFMVGVAGCLLAAQAGQPTAYNFPTQDSITLVAAALIGGVYSFWGAIVAGLLLRLVPKVFQENWGIDVNFVLILFGIGILQVLLTAPGGLADQFPKDMKRLGGLLVHVVRKVTRPSRSSA
jgi:branched-chain amino acid transport system permease protein